MKAITEGTMVLNTRSGEYGKITYIWGGGQFTMLVYVPGKGSFYRMVGELDIEVME